MALRVHQCHAREILAEGLWPDEEWTATRNRLRHALSSLRRELESEGTTEGQVLLATRADIRLNPERILTDVVEFRVPLVRAAESSNVRERVDLLRRAIEARGGDLLPGYYEDWIEESVSTWRKAIAALWCAWPGRWLRAAMPPVRSRR